MDQLRIDFENTFIVPFASRQWNSRRARTHWVDLEGWQDSIAGPLSSIVNSGGCEYVYGDDRFPGVDAPSSLRDWLLKTLAGLAARVEAFVPDSPAESADLDSMRDLIDKIRGLIERLSEIESRRASRTA